MISRLIAKHRSIFAAMLALVLLTAATNQLYAADQIVMRFHTAPQIGSTIVRLKDLVEIVSGSVPSLEKLGELPLGPAPREGTNQTWHASDILQHLELRGVHPQSIRWSGTDSVKLDGIRQQNPADSADLTPAFADQRIVDAASANVGLAIKEYLNLKSRSRTDWRIEVQIPEQHAKLLQSRRNIASIGGGQEPWTGSQSFTLQVKNSTKPTSIVVTASVELPPMVVVAVGPLRRDQMLTAELLKYGPLPPNANEKEYFTDIQQVVEKHLRRSISTNQAITEDLLGEPIIIQRNDLVEVESVAGSVVVRTSAKSLSSGAVGDLVDVELSNRRRLMATIVGPARVRLSAVSQSALSR